ncbi:MULTISPECIES: LytR/AlgR family response regulator transcription factor [Niastella]|uniref:Response regulator transcription factor n=1 Tax=Niastella soli TaxID=2821487 RepID=A0ABS3Z3N1_9BACT|nr:LytTR family DNA-binding domain-containing protein [Niastella soli]MBO9204769.1 response regulator transcription factor [Niastella soli]
MKIRSLIVDDEPLSQEILETYSKDLPVIELVQTCNNALEALEALKQHDIQLIFLDINMPMLSGINMVKTLTAPPAIIFTSAYAEYAIDGFDLDAIDYLVKPFSFERFVKAVNKVRDKLDTQNAAALLKQTHKEQDFIVIKADKKLYKLDYDDIIYFTSVGDYVKVFTKQGKVIITNETLRNIEMSLPGELFVRTHKSYIVSIKAIRYIEGNQVMVDNNPIPIGLTYKEELINRFNA